MVRITKLITSGYYLEFKASISRKAYRWKIVSSVPSAICSTSRHCFTVYVVFAAVGQPAAPLTRLPCHRERMSSDAEQRPWVVSDLVQIKASSEDEVKRRIEAFISNKRNEVDEQNIREFINPFTTEPGVGCARCEAVYLHREDGKSHITLKQVENTYGPQTRLPAEDFSSMRLPVDRERAEAVEERLANMEFHLNMENDGRSIFERLKSLEKRISFLEGLSPEYFLTGIPPNEQSNAAKPSFSVIEKEKHLYKASLYYNIPGPFFIDLKIRSYHSQYLAKMQSHEGYIRLELQKNAN
ncbi:MAP3k12-binding inhibitory protein 1 [Plakobranchus ocellatus]|uniref:MAP3k12-binding inhibitory protein 1 n=1 Tax=Plakobranchus ocellatus TaxID=259542 RepID=A0AAV3ZR25_9GAST|nr:MAP3k12-binding inhibitory protein 1 [Plakobranchus ocellatus]